MAARGLLARFLSLRRTNLGIIMRLFQHDSTLQCRNSFQKSSSMPKIAGFMTAAAAVVENVPKSGKLENVDPAKLTASYLLRNAAAANVDTAITLFNQTMSTFLEVHEKYINAIDGLLKLQDLLVSSFDNPQQEEGVWDALLVVRKKVNDYKVALTELEFLYASTERLVNNAAEAAYLAGAEFASSVASERLHAAQLRIKVANEQSRDAELSVSKKEAWVIQETAKHADRKKKTSSSEAGKEISASDAVVEHKSDAKTEVKKSEESEAVPSKDWFSVVFDRNDDKDMTMQNSCGEEQEDERKWANT